MFIHEVEINHLWVSPAHDSAPPLAARQSFDYIGLLFLARALQLILGPAGPLACAGTERRHTRKLPAQLKG